MESKRKNIALSIIFLVFVVGLSIGGYFYTKNITKDKKTNKTKEEVVKDLRVDQEKDYIYFENEKIISTEPEIVFTDVVINFQGAEVITSSLKGEMDLIRNSVVNISEENIDASKTKLYNDSNIFSAKERTYDVHKSTGYVSLVITDLDYNCYSDLTINNIKGYVFDIKTAKNISNEELLIKYSITTDDIKNRVSDHLDLNQSVVDEIEVIKKEDTLNNLFNSYALYLENGNLYISYVVKTNFVDYNDSIKIN